MAKSFTSMHIHFVFSTKYRENTISDLMKERLYAYLGGIAKQNKMIPLAIGGTSNHMHLLISMPPVISPSKGIQLLKTNSSKWINEEFRGRSRFTWQAGYSGFSVSPRHIQNVKNYIKRQEEHHTRRTFEQEYLDFLKDSGIEFDENHLWD